MKLNKRIGIIAGKVYRDINREMLKGILEQAFSEGFSASVFTPTEGYYDERINNAEYNILNVINFSLLDGVIYLPHTFATKTCREVISGLLKEKCTVPVVCADAEDVSFLSLWYDERKESAEMVRHLINQHGCRRIWYMTGCEDMQCSHNRLAGYKDAMEEAGLPYSDEDIIFGDFWVNSAAQLAEEIADGKRSLPDAVACANDCMAAALCDGLAKHGISVPEDVRITGYDGTINAALHTPTISTYKSSWKGLGVSCMCALYKEITGMDAEPVYAEKGFVFCGESCGCLVIRTDKYVDDLIYDVIEGDYQDNSLSTALLSAVNYKDFIVTLYDMESRFLDFGSSSDMHYCLCLCEDWKENGIEIHRQYYRKEGYSPIMYATDTPGSHTSFSSKSMLPEHLVRDVPSVTYFTPSHFQDRCFGYHTFTLYNIADSFEMKYMRFCREVNNALAFLVMQDTLKSLAFNSHIARSRDLLTGLYNLESFTGIWRDIAENAVLYNEGIYMIAISVNGLEQLEDVSGSLERDKLLVEFSERLMKCCGQREKLFRIGRGDFALIGTRHGDEDICSQAAARLEEQLRDIDTAAAVSVRYSSKEIPAGEFPEADAARDMLLQLADHAGGDHLSRVEQMYYKELVVLRRDIYEFPGRDWSLPLCSSRLNISITYFQKIYRKTFGVTCMHDIQKSKLDYAKKLLTHTNDTLQTIAELCGYDYSHFMRMFKKETGLTPTEYRRGKTI